MGDVSDYDFSSGGNKYLNRYIYMSNMNWNCIFHFKYKHLITLILIIIDAGASHVFNMEAGQIRVGGY